MNKYFFNGRYLKNWLYLISISQKYILFAFILIFTFKKNKLIYFGIFKEKNEEADDYIIKNNKHYLKPELVEKYNSFLDICKNGKLIDNTKYPLLKTPKISIIIPVHNGGKYLKKSLRTIQNQKLKEIEILIIDDCSTDDSLIYIKQLMQEDPRIRLIKNYKNRKILYSKSIAALNCNGKYILELDQDDMFLREDLFEIIYNESIKNNLDLLQFRDFVKEDDFFQRKTKINCFNLHWMRRNNTFYMEKSSLKETLFKDSNNYLLWGLLICEKIYKKAIYHIWEIIMNYQIIYNEDYISTTMIILLSNNYKYLNMFGILHLKHKQASSFNCLNKTEFHLSNIIFPSFLYEYHIKNNPEDINIIINYMNIKLNIVLQRRGSILYPELFEFNIRNIFYNNYLLPENKEKINNLFNITSKHSRILSSFLYIMNETEFNIIRKFQNCVINISKKHKKYISQTLNKNKLNKIHSQFIFINDSSSNFDINKIIKLKSKKNQENSKESFLTTISIIIYCNEIKFLEETLYSLIEQKNFFSFEIIIIYDNIEHLSLSAHFKYNNIYIINNADKKGIMYSFNKGILASKGKYILNLKSGYTLTKKNILKSLIALIEYENVDILEFNLLINKDDIINENSFDLYKCNHFNSTIDTNEIKYNKNYKEIDQNKELLINKIIKSDIYKDLIHKYKLNNYNEVIYNYYDDILNFLFDKQKYTLKHVDIFGIIKNIKCINLLDLNQISNNIQQKISDSVFYINFLFDHSLNDYREKKYVYDQYINKLGLLYNRYSPKSNKSLKLLRKFINCEYINEIERKELAFFYNSLIN